MQVSNLLADLGADLAASLPDAARRHVQELTSQLDRERLLDALTQSQASHPTRLCPASLPRVILKSSSARQLGLWIVFWHAG